MPWRRSYLRQRKSVYAQQGKRKFEEEEAYSVQGSFPCIGGGGPPLICYNAEDLV